MKKTYTHAELITRVTSSSTAVLSVLKRAGIKPLKYSVSGARTYRIWGQDAVDYLDNWRETNPVDSSPAHRFKAKAAAREALPVAEAVTQASAPVLASYFAAHAMMKDTHTRIIAIEGMLTRLVAELGGLSPASFQGFDDSTNARV